MVEKQPIPDTSTQVSIRSFRVENSRVSAEEHFSGFPIHSIMSKRRTYVGLSREVCSHNSLVDEDKYRLAWWVSFDPDLAAEFEWESWEASECSGLYAID